MEATDHRNLCGKTCSPTQASASCGKNVPNIASLSPWPWLVSSQLSSPSSTCTTYASPGTLYSVWVSLSVRLPTFSSRSLTSTVWTVSLRLVSCSTVVVTVVSHPSLECARSLLSTSYIFVYHLREGG